MIDSNLLDKVVRENIEILCRHFFPSGVKENGEWKIGDTSGAQGESLGISLNPEKAGLWRDRATDSGGKFAALIMENRNLNFPAAAEEIGRCVGIDLEAATGTNGAVSRRRDVPQLGFNWNSLDKLTDAQKQILSEWRGYSTEFVDWLDSSDLIRIYDQSNWAFPIVVGTKNAAGCHYRPIISGSGEKTDWHVEPSVKQGGPGMQPLVIGTLETALECCVFESTWDMFAACDKLGIQQTDSVVAFCTRGSGNGKRVGQILEKATVSVWMQNDAAAETWLDKVRETLGRPFYRVDIPKQFKDLNDWTRAGATAADLGNALKSATLIEVDPLDELQETKKPWAECLREGMCSSEQLSTLAIVPPELIAGDWLREGDLGFIFVQRGIGKTWVALDLAHGIADKQDVGPWQVHKQEKCLYLDGEMPPGDIKKRDYALGKPSKNLTYINHEILFERTGRVMNLADPEFQQGVLTLCIKEQFKVLLLDNLSCLARGMDENNGMDWELLLPWLLQLRRAHITVIFIAHAGRNNQMRGHSKREDPAFWIMRLDAPLDENEGFQGAHFITGFTKWRSIQKPATYEWSYKPVGNGSEDICIEFKAAAPIDVFRQLVESGLETATDIAEEMDVSKGYISRLATRGKTEGWLEINNRRYQLKNT